MGSDDNPGGDTGNREFIGVDSSWRSEIRQFGSAVREAAPLIGFGEPHTTDLLAVIGRIDHELRVPAPDDASLNSMIKDVRYMLIEFAFNPVAAMLADTAARLLGQDYGRLFR